MKYRKPELVWGVEKSPKGYLAHYQCKECKSKEKPYYSKGMCTACYDNKAITHKIDPATGKFYIRKKYKAIKQAEYDRKRRANKI